MKKIAVILTSFLAPGLGFVFVGKYRWAGLVYALSICLFVVANFVLNPWGLAITVLLSLGLLIGSAIFVGKFYDRQQGQMHWALGAIAFVAMIGIYSFGLFPLRKVAAVCEPLDSLTPALQNGDCFAMDRRPHEYQLGDIVAVKQEGGNLILRRIKGMDEEQVELGNDDVKNKTTTSSLENLTGKALYVLYSKEPDTSTWRFDRFLQSL